MSAMASRLFMTMFELIGERTEFAYGCDCQSSPCGHGGMPIQTSHEEEVVATFDTKKAARKYIKASRLKNPKDTNYPFRQKSLLRYYDRATIEKYVPPSPPAEPPHNPEI